MIMIISYHFTYCQHKINIITHFVWIKIILIDNNYDDVFYNIFWFLYKIYLLRLSVQRIASYFYMTE